MILVFGFLLYLLNIIILHALSAQEFCYALAIRYHKPLLDFPPKCDGCGATSSLDHFLIYRRGSLVVQRHNDIRDTMVIWQY